MLRTDLAAQTIATHKSQDFDNCPGHFRGPVSNVAVQLAWSELFAIDQRVAWIIITRRALS
jgi:hypothetical protein